MLSKSALTSSDNYLVYLIAKSTSFATINAL